MKIDIRKYLNLRESLIQERAKLQSRLQEIDSALGASTIAPESRSLASPARGPSTRAGRRGPRSGLSLREAVIQAIGQGSHTKEEILAAVKNLGYRFTTNNPMNSLGVILYGKNPKFKNDGGRFSLGRGAQPASAAARSEGASPRKRRKLSPEARERIAAAQRARWAKTKSK